MDSCSQGLDPLATGVGSHPCAGTFLLAVRSCLFSTEALWSPRDMGWPTLVYVLLLVNKWTLSGFFLCSSLAVGTALWWEHLHHCLPSPSHANPVHSVIWVNCLEIWCKVNAGAYHNPFKYTSAQWCLVCLCSTELFLNLFLTSFMWETGWKSLPFGKEEVRLASPTDPSDLSVFVLGLSVFIWRAGGLLLQDCDKEGKKRNRETKLQQSGKCLG